MRPSLARRQEYNLGDLMDDLIRDDTDPVTNELNVTGFSHFKNFTRMSVEDFDYLTEAITPYVKRQDTTFRKAISVRERLGVTLRFLATGDSYRSMNYLGTMSHASVGDIVPEVCQAIIQVLRDQIKVSQILYMIFLKNLLYTECLTRSEVG